MTSFCYLHIYQGIQWLYIDIYYFVITSAAGITLLISFLPFTRAFACIYFQLHLSEYSAVLFYVPAQGTGRLLSRRLSLA